MKFSKDFKEAISLLPDKEKDKLILRLLKKDLKLADRLEFELLSEKSIEDKRTEIENGILIKAAKTAEYFHSLGYLNTDVRSLSGEISVYVYTTKDKFGEVYLNLKMINKVLSVNKDNINNAGINSSARKFFTAVIARAYKILILTSKLHEDLYIELENEFNSLGNTIANIPNLMHVAIYNSFDVNWLLGFKIPEDIVENHKDLRQNGYLR